MSTTYGTESILVDKNIVRNDALFEAGTYKKGEIVARKISLVGVGSADAGNTGNATFTASSIVANGKAKKGVYTLTWSAATAYAVADPDGADIGTGNIADGFTSPQIDFGITVGSTAMVSGDILYVTVSVDSVKYTTYVAGNSDGSGKVKAICLQDQVLSADGYLSIAKGEFSLAGVQAVMSALTTPITIDNEMLGDLDDVGVILNNS